MVRTRKKNYDMATNPEYLTPPPTDDKEKVEKILSFSERKKHENVLSDAEGEDDRSYQGEMPELEGEAEDLVSELFSDHQPPPVDRDTKPLSEERKKKLEERKREDALLTAFTRLARLDTQVVQLPSFGDGELTADQFFRKFERVSNLNGWTKDEKVQILTSCLKRRVLTLYKSLPLDIQSDYEKAKKAVLAHNDAPEMKARLRNELYTKKQGDTPLEPYLERLEYLFGELQIPESTKIDILMANLNPQLSYKLQIRQPRRYTLSLIHI